MGIIVNHELGLTEVRIRQLQSIVDIFVILESKITSGMLYNCIARILQFCLPIIPYYSEYTEL